MDLAKSWLSSGVFNKMQLVEELELLLGSVWRMLQEVDGDLAEFAANMFEQSMHIVDYAMHVSNTSTSHLVHKEAIGLHGRIVCQLEATMSDQPLKNLQQKLDVLHEHTLCLIDCTEVVDDHQLILCAGRQNNRERKASRCALKHLHQVDTVLGSLRHDIASGTSAISIDCTAAQTA